MVRKGNVESIYETHLNFLNLKQKSFLNLRLFSLYLKKKLRNKIIGRNNPNVFYISLNDVERKLFQKNKAL